MSGSFAPQAPGVVYWEKQDSRDKLCGLHCLNSSLQGPYFTEVDLADYARELDAQEALLLNSSSLPSENMDFSGNFSLGVLEKALRRQGLDILNSMRGDVRAEVMDRPGEKEDAFIFNLSEHWFAVRRISGPSSSSPFSNEWYNLDSLKPCPAKINDYHLGQFIKTTMERGYSVFTIRGSRLPPPDPLARPARRKEQMYLTPSDIDSLCLSASAEEKAMLSSALGSADEEKGGAFTVHPPKKKEEVDWGKLGGGQRLDGGGGERREEEEESDPDLLLALAASRSELQNSLPQPEPEVEKSSPSALPLQIRFPSSRISRVLDVNFSIVEVFKWAEFESAQDGRLSPSPLSTLSSYVLIKNDFPKKRFKKLSGEGKVLLNDEDVSGKKLKELGFEARQGEALLFAAS